MRPEESINTRPDIVPYPAPPTPSQVRLAFVVSSHSRFPERLVCSPPRPPSSCDPYLPGPFL